MTRKHPSLRLTAVLLSLLLLLSLFPVTAQAATSGGFEYTVNSDGTATITKYTGSDTNVVVPATIDGHRAQLRIFRHRELYLPLRMGLDGGVRHSRLHQITKHAAEQVCGMLFCVTKTAG